MDPRRALLTVALLLAPGLAAPAAAAEGELHTFQVQWRVLQSEFPYEGRLDEGADRTFSFLVEQANVTSIEFLLTWREAEDSMRISGPDEFSMEVRAPDGSQLPESPGRSSSGRLAVAARDLNPIPPGRTVAAASPEEVRQKLGPEEGRRGMGAWAVTVQLESTGNPRGVQSDPGNPYRLAVLLTYYEASVMRVVTLGDATGQGVGFIASVARAEPHWLWTTGGLAALALGLGAFLLVDGVRRRRSRSREEDP